MYTMVLYDLWLVWRHSCNSPLQLGDANRPKQMKDTIPKHHGGMTMTQRIIRNNCMTAFPTKSNVANVDSVIDELMSDWLNAPAFFSAQERQATAVLPAVDIDETDDKLSIVADLAGMKRDEIEVLVHERVLTISGNRETVREEKNDGYRRHEIKRGSFKRSFTLPKTVDVEKIAANYENGLLKIVFPKIEAAKPKRIEVTVK